MGPTWIVIVVWKHGGVEIDEFTLEEDARKAFDAATAGGDYVDAYLAPVRAEAHS